ncbi:hypothetical protein BGZ97_011160 [Linnemannia gamsii]|jgi:hypothetical protein|uniref:Uncharacterized protein n=1 Tax=Linnemannia gamsii TaxID=64522 RepID=A0A9P6UNA3_9FUNG|nr:hypothetical protein BGZ97_011160 [Linnemannia gamsii]
MRLTSLLLAAILLVQSLVDAGAYTVNACTQTNMITVWDSDEGYGRAVWAGESGFVLVGNDHVKRRMDFKINYLSRAATITYRSKTLKWKSPNDVIFWDGILCYQYWGSY